MSSAKDYVKQYFPDAYLAGEPSLLGFEIRGTNDKWQDITIGNGNNESRELAWEDAKQWIDSLSDENKPKIK